jgi:hypothetical protein
MRSGPAFCCAFLLSLTSALRLPYFSRANALNTLTTNPTERRWPENLLPVT